MRGWPRSSAPTRFRAVRASASRKSRKVFFSLLFSTHRGPDKWSRQLRTLSSFDIAPKCLALISHRALFAVDHSPTKFPFLSSFCLIHSRCHDRYLYLLSGNVVPRTLNLCTCNVRHVCFFAYRYKQRESITCVCHIRT